MIQQVRLLSLRKSPFCLPQGQIEVSDAKILRFRTLIFFIGMHPWHSVSGQVFSSDQNRRCIRRQTAQIGVVRGCREGVVIILRIQDGLPGIGFAGYIIRCNPVIRTPERGNQDKNATAISQNLGSSKSRFQTAIIVPTKITAITSSAHNTISLRNVREYWRIYRYIRHALEAIST